MRAPRTPLPVLNPLNPSDKAMRRMAWAIAVIVYVALPARGPIGNVLAASPLGLMIAFWYIDRR